MEKTTNKFVRKVMKVVPKGMAKILFDKGKTVYAVKVGKFGGARIDPKECKRWGMSFDDATKSIPKDFVFKYPVNA